MSESDGTYFPPPSNHKEELEAGDRFTPKFGQDGLLTAIVTEASTGTLLMVAHMNAEAVQKTIETDTLIL